MSFFCFPDKQGSIDSQSVNKNSTPLTIPLIQVIFTGSLQTIDLLFLLLLLYQKTPGDWQSIWVRPISWVLGKGAKFEVGLSENVRKECWWWRQLLRGFVFSTTRRKDSIWCSSRASEMDIYEVTFDAKWQIWKCVLRGLDGDSSHAWAVRCLDYVENIWSDAGRHLLSFWVIWRLSLRIPRIL